MTTEASAACDKWVVDAGEIMKAMKHKYPWMGEKALDAIAVEVMAERGRRVLPVPPAAEPLRIQLIFERIGE